ncbi:caspase family protein [Pseudogemmobacter blasticus]|uniref:Peptidase C14 n=1 Tax=Fuscovulum blasticum DSM 2131 TaxID=1188250 RepID=A0A2T4J8E3_FUSBL|nr:caspase family protein [Fuscovulum blasticum]PTE14162.1 peptidase C14 [Fuscovulum blasticum DSM 2131]
MFRSLCLTTALALVALPAMARENYAILIGANQYQNLDERWWLRGPKNDVELVATYLTTEAPVPFPADHVTLLTDGVEGVQPATLGAIRDAFAKVTAEAQPGDFVYLHFSGHGTQAPATHDDTELDGLDELFLPVDIGPWSDSVGAVENALVDDEIGRLIDGIRAKGADVWVVFDSCHSGTATRAVEADDEVRTRQLDPSVLGLDPAAMEDVASRGIGEEDPRAAAVSDVADAAPAGEGMGNFVAFYAAQTNEVTPEKNLPKGKPDRKPHGVFTYTLFETLAEYPSATYGQIAQEVLRKYSVKNLAKTTPLFEGDLDAVAFSGAEGGRVAQWPATVEGGSFSLPAGELHGLSQGAVLAVMATAADPTEAALGYVEVTGIDTFTATATAVEKDGKALPAELPKGLYLRKLDDALDFTLTVALPEPGTAPADALLAALDTLTAEAGPRLNFVAAGAEADLRLAVIPDSPRPDAIWVLPATGLADDLSTTPSVGTAGKDGATLAVTLTDTLAHMSKALNLMKLGGAVGGGDMQVEVEMLTRNVDTPALTPLPVSPVPVLLSNDEVHVLAKNHMDVPVDVNVLYIGADYSISHWAAERLQPGDELKKGLFAIGGEVMGQERMIVIVTPAKPQSPVENLSYLAQDALETTRSLGGSAFNDALTEAGFGETTRGAVALSAPEEDTGPAPMILQMELRTKAAN